jgi:hypothetical protein
MIDLLITFLIFAVIVTVVFYAVRWLMAQAGLAAELQKIVLLVLGLTALIILLVRFVKPLLHM